MNILVINSGSSSIKYQLFNGRELTPVVSGVIEKIGEPNGRVHHKILTGSKTTQHTLEDTSIPTHQHGLSLLMTLLLDEENGVLDSPDAIVAVGHRVVHGGETFSKPTIIDETAKEAIAALIPLAPLHNPANLRGIEVAQALFPNATQVAVFDTAFHQTMPPEAYRYAVPTHLYEAHSVRVYGFHGTSHHFVSKQAADYLDQPLEALNLITAHLGNGCSITAVKNGRSIDTSMGFTPLAGLMMGTRSGDVDPALPYFLNTTLGMSPSEIDHLLNKESGLLGVTETNDVREIESRMDAGDEVSRLALKMYGNRIKKYIGAYTAVLGHVDALIFTAGVGENSQRVRQMACEGLDGLGIALDLKKNSDGRAGAVTPIHKTKSDVQILIIPTNEELEIASQVYSLLFSGS